MKQFLKYEAKSNSLFYSILLANILNIGALFLKIFKSNSNYFFETIFQFVNLYCIILLIIASVVFYRQYKIYLFISILFFLDLTFYLKQFLQSLVSKFISATDLFLVHIVVLIILVLLSLFLYLAIFKFGFYKYLISVLLIFYSISMYKSVFVYKTQTYTKNYVPIRIESISKNAYILLFDEYPKKNIFQNYVNQHDTNHIENILLNENFKVDHNIFSNHINTEKSTLDLLTGQIQENSNISNTIQSLSDNIFSEGFNYKFYPISIFDNINRPNSLVSTQFFENYTNITTRYIIPYLFHYFNKRGVGNFTDYDDYHLSVINAIEILSRKKGKHIVYAHFYTPHIYPNVENKSFTKRLQNANQWLIIAINIIQNNDPSSGIIIISDHGLRWSEIPNKLWNQNILYYKNVEIDTVEVNKAGLVGLFRATKF